MFTITEFNENYSERWDKFVGESENGTIFHNLDFLNYHGNRFKENENHLIWLKGEAIFAQMPLGIFHENGEKVLKSPYGASWGGLVHSPKFQAKHALEVVEKLIDYLKENNISKAYITPPPEVYYDSYNCHFEFAMCSLGFKLHRRELHSVTQLPATKEDVWNTFTSKTRNITKKAIPDFEVIPDVTPVEFYPILLEDKVRHNNSKPTHTLEDLNYLKEKFPQSVIFDIAVGKDGSKAGICYFICNPNCHLTFYMSQEDKAVGRNGVNVLVKHGMERAVASGAKYFDFGGSSVNMKIENVGVAHFKEGFGAKGIFRDTYRWESNETE